MQESDSLKGEWKAIEHSGGFHRNVRPGVDWGGNAIAVRLVGKCVLEGHFPVLTSGWRKCSYDPMTCGGEVHLSLFWDSYVMSCLALACEGGACCASEITVITVSRRVISSMLIFVSPKAKYEWNAVQRACGWHVSGGIHQGQQIRHGQYVSSS
jgi:hypothetical protein